MHPLLNWLLLINYFKSNQNHFKTYLCKKFSTCKSNATYIKNLYQIIISRETNKLFSSLLQISYHLFLINLVHVSIKCQSPYFSSTNLSKYYVEIFYTISIYFQWQKSSKFSPLSIFKKKSIAYL